MTFKDFVRVTRPHTAALTIPGVLLLTRLRAWARVTRLNTVSFTVSCALVGATIARADALTMLALTVWVVGYHAMGMLSNNLMDFESDQRDPSKSWFPLVTGEVNQHSAKRVLLTGSILFTIIGFMLSRGSSLTMLVLTISILSGFAYNMKSKSGVAAIVWLALSFGTLPVLGYLVADGDPTLPLPWLLGLSLALFMCCDTMVFGYWKDLASDRVNVFRYLGSSAKSLGEDAYEYHMNTASRTFASVIRIASVTPLFFIMPHGTTWLMVTLLMLVLMMSWSVLRQVSVARSKAIRVMMLTEIVAYGIILASLTPAYFSWMTLALFVAIPTLVFMVLNWFVWERLLAPRV